MQKLSDASKAARVQDMIKNQDDSQIVYTETQIWIPQCMKRKKCTNKKIQSDDRRVMHQDLSSLKSLNELLESLKKLKIVLRQGIELSNWVIPNKSNLKNCSERSILRKVLWHSFFFKKKTSFSLFILTTEFIFKHRWIWPKKFIFYQSTWRILFLNRWNVNILTTLEEPNIQQLEYRRVQWMEKWPPETSVVTVDTKKMTLLIIIECY